LTPRWRGLFWVQSLLGSGHLRRALLVAEALAARGAAVTLVNGGPSGPWSAPTGVDLVQLPAVTARGGDFGDLVDAAGQPFDERLRAERIALLLDHVARQPQVILTEMFPFGRRVFRAELLAMLDAAAMHRPRPIVCASVRDILVSKPDPGRSRWMVEACLAHYDRVLVHGDARLMPFSASFPPAAELGERIVHTGFVHPGAMVEPLSEAPAVLVSAGGGAVGERLLRAALSARPRSRYAKAPWLLVGGHNLPAETFAVMASDLPVGCALERHRPDLAALIGRCELSVSQAGYNTVVEGLAAGARMVLVPFAAGDEDEQEQRAARLARLGLAERVNEAEIDGPVLAATIDRASAKRRPDPGLWSFTGAEQAAAIVADLVRERFGVA
jgi:predicted glycosyltransferase